MAYHIAIYRDNPTVNLTDGTIVSENDFSNPVDSNHISIPATGSTNGNWVKLAVRCDEGTETIFDLNRHARISLDGSGNTNWQLAEDNSGSPSSTPLDWGLPLDITEIITDTNYIFWTRAKANSTESVSNDTSIEIIAQALVGNQPWTWNISDMSVVEGIGEATESIIIPEDCTLYYTVTGDMPTFAVYTVGGDALNGWIIWISNYDVRTFSFIKDQVVAVSILYSNSGTTGTHIIRENDENGRIIAQFNVTCT